MNGSTVKFSDNDQLAALVAKRIKADLMLILTNVDGLFKKFNKERQKLIENVEKVTDDILERMKNVSIEEAWGVLRKHDYHYQFERNWVITQQNPVLVGRAVTAFYQPLRPDMNDLIKEKGEKEGRIGGQIPGSSTPLSMAMSLSWICMAR